MDTNPEALYLGLGTGWPGADASGGEWQAHLTVRLGERALTAHLGTQPVLRLANNLVVALLSIQHHRAAHLVPLANDHVLFIRGSPGRLLVNVRGARVVVVDAPAADVVKAVRSFLGALERAAPSADYRNTIRAARARLNQPLLPSVPLRSRADLSAPTTADRGREVRPAALRLAWRDGLDRATLEFVLGEHRVRLAFANPAEPAERLCGALEAMLHARDWPQGRHLFRFEDADDRRLQLIRVDDQVEVNLLDPGDHPLAPPAVTSVHGFAEVITGWINTCPDPKNSAQLRRLRAESARLCAWSAALSAGDQRGLVEGAPAWLSLQPKANPPSRALPVRDLMHLAWRRRWRTEAPHLARVAVVGDRLLVSDGEGLHALDLETGAVVWRRSEIRPIDGADPTFGLGPEGELQRIDHSGAIVWKTTKHAKTSVRTVRTTPTVTLIGDDDRTLVAVGPNGSEIWRYRTHYGAVSQVLCAGKRVMLFGEDGFVHCVHRDTGAPLFQTRVPGEPEGVMCPTREGLLVATNREPDLEGEITLLNPRTGEPRWSWRVRAALVGDLQALGDDRVTGVADVGGVPTLVCLEVASGRELWRTALSGCPPPVVRSTSPTAVYVKGADGQVFAIARGEYGRLLWVAEADDPHLELSVNAPARLCRGVLLVPGRQIRAIDPANGRVVCALDCGELVPSWMHARSSGDLVIAEDDAVVAYTLGGHLALVR